MHSGKARTVRPARWPRGSHNERRRGGRAGAGEVRIRVDAIGLNRAEIMYRDGVYFDQPVFPSTLGYEAAGVIEAVGEGVDGLAEGDAVSVVPAFLQSG